jgi:hypothetical protein
MDLTPDTRLIRAEERFLSNPVGDETLLLDLSTGDYVALNETAARIWDMLRQPRTVRELTDALGNEFDIDPGQCLSDTLGYLRAIEALQLLVQV